MTELTEAEVERLCDWYDTDAADWGASTLLPIVAEIIDARLAPIRALADQWEAENEKPSKSRYVRWARRSHAYALRAALSGPQDAPQPTSGTEGQQYAEHRPNACCDHHRYVEDGCCHCEVKERKE